MNEHDKCVLNHSGIPHFYLPEAHNAYRQAIFDVIRIFFPQFQWTEEASLAELSAQQINVETIQMEQNEQTWTLMIGENRSVFRVEGLDENQCRRLLKQEVYAFLQQYTKQKEHPWGIMTGVRPTKIVHRCLDEKQSKEEISRMLRQDYLMNEEKTNLLLEVTARQSQNCRRNTSPIFCANVRLLAKR